MENKTHIDNLDNEIHLTDLIGADTLQRVQDAFSAMTGMAALTTDKYGIPVTKGSNFTTFCSKYARGSAVGHLRCEQCDRMGAENTMRDGKLSVYYCHAGLMDFAAPILANGEMVGSFIGGQVLPEPADKEKITEVAMEIGVEPDAFWEAVQEVQVLDKKTIDEAAKFLYTITNIFSDVAYGKYMAIQANKDLEKTANMKSDFLANMSHEIRTPMNAIIGMAEMALREDLSPTARDYLCQIKSSGKALLTIINDILDFSKIESGKMDIFPVEYEPMSVVNDMANIVVTRLKGKDVELVLDVSPDIPHKLLGDNIRIKQILLNLTSNATKFTNRGQVRVKIAHEVIDDRRIMLKVDVQDTGIGIKKEDLSKLFQSFQQVDSKRNRNIEGTGLGLAISQRLVYQMGGEVKVESEYGKGSTFSFSIPQTVVDDRAGSRIEHPDKVVALGLFANPYVRDQFIADCACLGVPYKGLDEVGAVPEDKEVFFFVEEAAFTPEIKYLVENTPGITAVLMAEQDSTEQVTLPNLLLVRKPLYTLTEALIFNRQSLHSNDQTSDDLGLNFVAPDAKILIVDDNGVNLTVAVGLLEPLKMQIDTALSGKEAVEKISGKRYDIVFMDHMMPEIDGVETTRIIRRLHPEYNDVPIIALTANAVGGVKEMFLREGMNDFIAKPIELKNLVTKVRQWLPVEKVQETEIPIEELQEMETEMPEVGDLDTKSAIALLGNAKLFWKVLKDYYRTIDKKCILIKELEQKEDWPAYTIEVHALKSASKQIGAMRLSELAAEMEKAGNARDSKLIHKHTDEMLMIYNGYLEVLEPYCKEEKKTENTGREATAEEIESFFASMRAALEDLNLDGMEEVIAAMGEYSYTDWQEEQFARLKEAVDNVDVDACETIVNEWEQRRNANN